MLRALFLIASKGCPPFKNPEYLSAELKSFIQDCTIMNPDERPSTADLVAHPFLRKACPPRDLVALAQKTKSEAVKDFSPWD